MTTNFWLTVDKVRDDACTCRALSHACTHTCRCLTLSARQGSRQGNCQTKRCIERSVKDVIGPPGIRASLLNCSCSFPRSDTRVAPSASIISSCCPLAISMPAFTANPCMPAESQPALTEQPVTSTPNNYVKASRCLPWCRCQGMLSLHSQGQHLCSTAARRHSGTNAHVPALMCQSVHATPCHDSLAAGAPSLCQIHTVLSARSFSCKWLGISCLRTTQESARFCLLHIRDQPVHKQILM